MSSPARRISAAPPALFAGLPPSPRRGRYFGYSFVVQSVLVVILVHYGVIQPAKLVPERLQSIVLAVPPVPVNHAPQRIPPHLLVPAPRIKTELPQLAKIELPPVPKIAEVPERQPVLPDVKPLPVAPRIKTGSFQTAAASERPAPRPIPQVQTGAFGTGSSATPTAIISARKVQTGGFGDPNGVPASAHMNNGNPANIAQLGSFDLPSGPGYGNGTGGASGRRAVVASAGFGNGIAVGGGGSGDGSGLGTVRDSGFTDASVRQVASTQPRRADPPALSPVQIEYKPKPAYSAEARQLRLEGEVLVEVVFTADGRVQVKRVVRGLGHGLDEQAVKAAQQIRFKPATRGGTPVDATALLHIVFQLA